MSKALVTRNTRGQFVKGNNAGKGRPLGVKNKATLARELVEAKGTLQMARAAPHIIQKMLEMAMAGDKDAMKMVIDRMLPKNQQGTDQGNAAVQVIIQNLTTQTPAEKPVEGATVIIEGTTV